MQLVQQVLDETDGHFILVLDCAPQHVAVSWTVFVREELSWCHLIFVPRGTTSFAQPRDRAYMRSFKSSLREAAVECSVLWARPTCMEASKKAHPYCLQSLLAEANALGEEFWQDEFPDLLESKQLDAVDDDVEEENAESNSCVRFSSIEG
eukprot:5524393-Amphidinium_carterae.2